MLLYENHPSAAPRPRTEEAFNHYMGVDELQLVEEFMRKSTRRRAA